MAQIHALTPEGRLPAAAVAHTAEIADDALGTIPERTAPIQRGADDGFAVTDQAGAQALAVTPDGTVMVGSTEHREDTPGYRVMDEQGRIALEVTADGRTHAYDLATGGGSSEVTTLHTFLAIGQSNMDGRGRPYGGDLDPVDPRIFQYGANRRIIEPATVPLDMPDAHGGISPATTFAREYLATQPAHVGVLLIPAARSGTRFTTNANEYTWLPGAASAPEWDLPQQAIAQTQEALAADPRAVLKGALWHQGEGNSTTPTAVYAGYLDLLIATLRTDLGEPRLPFLVGQMTPEGIDVNPNKLNPDRAHMDTPARVEYTAFAPLPPGGVEFSDTTHISRHGAEMLGRSYLDAYHRALDNAGANNGPQPPRNVQATFRAGALHITWEQQARRVTSYRVEYRIDGGEWVEVSREWPMNLYETVTGLTGTIAEVRVTCVNGSREMANYFPALAPHIAA